MANQLTAPAKGNVAVLLPPSVASSLRETVNNDFLVTGYTVAGKPPDQDLRDAIKTLDGLCSPASSQEIGMWIATLYALTKQRGEDQIGLDLAVEAFGSRLEKLPREAVKAALETWPEKSTWWPSWKELKDEIDRADVAGMMRQAIYRALDKKQPTRTSGPRQVSEVNQMDRAEFLAELRRKNPEAFGFKTVAEAAE